MLLVLPWSYHLRAPGTDYEPVIGPPELLLTEHWSQLLTGKYLRL